MLIFARWNECRKTQNTWIPTQLVWIDLVAMHSKLCPRGRITSVTSSSTPQCDHICLSVLKEYLTLAVSFSLFIFINIRYISTTRQCKPLTSPRRGRSEMKLKWKGIAECPFRCFHWICPPNIILCSVILILPKPHTPCVRSHQSR